MAQGEFFVQIQDSTEIRRILLENSKQVIKILQRYESLKDQRIRKQELISKLRGVNREIQLLVQKLERVTPKTIISAKTKQKTTKKEHTRRMIVPQTKELNKLESELMEIESKLGRLKH